MVSEEYVCGYYGKWHLGDQPDFLPAQHGFDSYFGLPYRNDIVPDLSLDLSTGRRNFPPLSLMQNEDVIQLDPNQAWLTNRYTAEVFALYDLDDAEPTTG